MNGFAVRRRVTGATLALLLQALFIALLVVSMRPVATPVKLIRELTLVLPRLKTEPPPPPPATASAPSRAPAAPLPVLPQILPPPAASAAAPSPEGLRNLGQSIFGCAPENYSSLTPQQRALCPRPGEGVAVQNAPSLGNAPLHVKDEAHWAAELKKRNTPLTIPCVRVVKHDLGFGHEEQILMVDPVCTLKHEE